MKNNTFYCICIVNKIPHAIYSVWVKMYIYAKYIKNV